MREDGETLLASQMSLINHVHQGNDMFSLDYPYILLTGASGKLINSLTWHARWP